MMALALLRLARMTDREDFRRGGGAGRCEAFSSRMTSGGAGVPQMLVALAFALGKPMEIVLAGRRSDARHAGGDPAAISAGCGDRAGGRSRRFRCRRSTARRRLTLREFRLQSSGDGRECNSMSC